MSNQWSSTYDLSDWIEWQDMAKAMEAKQNNKHAELLTFLENMYKDGLTKVYLEEHDIRALEEYVYSVRPSVQELVIFPFDPIASVETAIGYYKLHLYIYRTE